jgi:hypothetical protein
LTAYLIEVIIKKEVFILMKSDYKTKAQLLQELEEMRQKVSEVDSCRIEYENVSFCRQ